MTKENYVIILDDATARKIMAKVIVIAVKEATGEVQTSGKRKREAQEFLLSDWAYSWAEHLGQGRQLEHLCCDIVNGHYPVNGRGNEHAEPD